MDGAIGYFGLFEVTDSQKRTDLMITYGDKGTKRRIK